MTQEGRVDDIWTATRRDRPADDNVRPLLQALAAARRSLDEDHLPEADHLPEEALPTTPDAIVVDIRPAARTEGRPPGTGAERPAMPARPSSTGAAEDAVAAAARAAAEASAAVARAIAARPRTADWIMVEPDAPETPARRAAQPAPQWGDLWRESVQGWVRAADGTKVWRPIVTTTTSVPNWDIDSNLGMVTGESACALDTNRLLLEVATGSESLQEELARDRRLAQEAMVRDAVSRGAHAVIGVNLDYTPVGECIIVTATGTAVTLRIAH